MKKFRILGWPFDRVFQTGMTLQASQAGSFSRNLDTFPAWLAWSSNFLPIEYSSPFLPGWPGGGGKPQHRDRISGVWAGLDVC